MHSACYEIFDAVIIPDIFIAYVVFHGIPKNLGISLAPLYRLENPKLRKKKQFSQRYKWQSEQEFKPSEKKYNEQPAPCVTHCNLPASNVTGGRGQGSNQAL